jgi:transglutaminase-like putative cysteine protease
MARETQGCRAIHRDCRYFQHVDCRIVWNLRQDPRLLWNQTKSLILKIWAGYDIAFNCIQQVPMLLMLSVHPSRRSDLLSDDKIEFSPKVQARDFKDAFGNICSRLVAPTGLLEVRNEFAIADSGEPDIIATDAAQWPIDALPDDALMYLLGSRYCDTQKPSDFAWSMFGRVEGGKARARRYAKCVHDRIEFGYHHARDDRTASEGHQERIGVCRDFAHLAIAFCQCMNIPARYCTGYLGI